MYKIKKCKSTILRFLALTISIITAFGLTSCSSIKDSMGGGVEITENAYIVDKETGDYRALIIVENSGDSVMKELLYSADGYDADGKRIELVEHEDEEGNKWHEPISASCNLLGPGQKTACVATNVDIEGDGLQYYYQTIPETLEWNMDSMKPEKELEANGLEVTGCDLTYSDGDEDIGEYVVTLHNSSSTDYIWNPDDYGFLAGGTPVSGEVVAVYRDSEGEIKDFTTISPYPNSVSDIPAGGDTTWTCYSNHVCIDEDLVPEYYYTITYLEYSN